MIGKLSSSAKQNLTNALFPKHNDILACKDNQCNNQGSDNRVATRIPVIKSTVFISETQLVGDTINGGKLVTGMPLVTEQPAKKPYGGRPLKYECGECKRRFHAPSHLKRHVMSHSTERPFHCRVCNKGFLQAWHLGRHMTTHTGNKPFKCLECSKSFGSRFEMKTHINYIHRGIKEHRCRVCGKHFTLRSNLKVHMRKHTGEKPYECRFCLKRFGQKGHLQYHIRKHEGKEENQPIDKHEVTSNFENAITPFGRGKIPSVSDQASDCHDDDVSMTSDRDSGIGSYDSEVESVTNSACSSPTIRDIHDDQLSSCDSPRKVIKRQPSPEFGIVSMTQCCTGREVSPSNGKHSSIKPYVCYSCNCGFAEVNSLRAHVRHSHPRKGIASGDYRCAHCLKSYQFVNDLQMHVKERHQQICQFSSSSVASAIASKKRSFSQSFPSCKQPLMSPKSLAFSIESLCSDVVPSKKKMAQITHLHSADSFVHSKDSVFTPGSVNASRKYGLTMDPLMKYPESPNSDVHSFFTYPVNMHPMCIY